MEQSELVAVGIDVSKEGLGIAVRPSGEQWSERNDVQGVRRLVKRLQALGCRRIVVEATGGYETVLVVELRVVKLPVVLVNPRWVRAFARSQGQLAKTDAIDARILALYAERAELKVRELPDAQVREFGGLCARRAELLDMQTAEENRLEHAGPSVKREITSHIADLRKRIGRLDRELRRRLRESELWRELDQLLDSVPGVGPVLRSAMVAWLPELGRLNRGEVAALVGVAPLNQDSGKWRGTRHIAGGRARLRKVLYMGTFGALQHNPYLRAYYQRLRTTGKKHKVAMVATMRKLLLILNAIVKTRTPWNEATCAGANP